MTHEVNAYLEIGDSRERHIVRANFEDEEWDILLRFVEYTKELQSIQLLREGGPGKLHINYAEGAGFSYSVELPSDELKGRIIGKEGRTAKSIRTLLRVLGAKEHARVNMKIIEPEGSETPRAEKPVMATVKESKTVAKESATEEIMPIEEKSTGVI